jgi:hypothetical protein
MNHKRRIHDGNGQQALQRFLWKQTVRKNIGTHDQILSDPAISRCQAFHNFIDMFELWQHKEMRAQDAFSEEVMAFLFENRNKYS